MTFSRMPFARIAASRACIALMLCPMFLGAGPAAAQQLDESCSVTVNGQTVQVNPDGSFVIPNIAAADLFGAGGPGTPPDFLSDDFFRVIGTCLDGQQEPLYVYGECFRIRRGESALVGNLTFSSTPPQALASVTAAPGIPTLTAIGQQTLINITGSFSDGTSGPLNPKLHCPTTFRTSNPAIVSVLPDPSNPIRGLATARGTGTALITASIEGATSVTSITVSLGDPLTTITGIVQTTEGDPVDGATVRFVVNGALIAGNGTTGPPGLAPGQFIVSGLASQLGPISAYATATIDGAPRSGVSLQKAPVASGFTDAGLITLDNRVFWITNANGLWATAANWVSGAQPTPTQIAVIDVPAAITVTHQTFPATPIVSLQCAESLSLSGALTLAQASFVNGTFSQSAGTLSGIGTLTANGPCLWTGGTMDGGGTTLLNAGMTMSGSGTKALFGRTLTNANNGTITWTGSGLLSFASQPVINNQAGCTFDVQTDADWNGGLPFGAFNNSGTLRKSAGSGVTALGGLLLNNSGSVDVEVGTLQVVGGSSSGVFFVDPGATLDFTPHFGPPQNISGSVTVPAGGTLQFTLGTTNLNGPTDVDGQIVVTSGFNNNGVGIFNAAASMGVAASSVSISGGTLSFAGPASAGSASHTSGNLSGAGTLTVTGPYTWTGGTMDGGGTTLLNGGMTMSGSATKALFGRTLTNANNGTITWTGSGLLSFASQPVINNQAGCTFDVQTDADWNGGLPFGAFNNAGTLRKSAGSGVTTLGGLALNNSGSVEVEVGTLQVVGGNSSGDFVVDPGAALEFTPNFGPAQNVSGSLNVPVGGTLHFSSGTTNLNGPTDITGQIGTIGGFNNPGVANFSAAASIGVAATSASISSGGTLSFAGPASVGSVSHGNGTLSGAGTLNVTGPYTWTEGTMTGGGTTLLNGGMTMSGSSTKALFGRTLTNANNGTITWTGSGLLSLSSQPVINNQAGCIFDVQTDADWSGGLPFGAFNNSGTLRKSAGSGVTMLGGLALNNSGSVEVEVGTLQVVGGNSSGDFVVDPGAALHFSGGFGPPQNITGSLSVPVGGTVQFSSGTTNLNGPTDVDGQIVTTGGTGNFSATASPGVAATSLTINNGGTLNFAGPASVGSVSHGNGTLGGAGTLMVTGPYNWSGAGIMGGGGITLLNGGMTISTGGGLSSRTLTNANNGTITWIGGNMSGGTATVINNQAGSTIDVQTDADLTGGTGTLNNAGTLRKSAGTASTTLLSINVINTGVIEVTNGTLEFPSSGPLNYTQTSGSTVLAGGSVSRSGFGPPLQINGGTIGLGAGTPTGTITGSVTCGGSPGGMVTPRPGASGKLTITGTYTQNASGTLDIELGGTSPASEHDQLAVGGTAVLAGTLNLSLINDFVATAGQQFTIVTAGAVSGTFANTVLVNFPVGLAATISYSGNAVTVTITNQ